MIEKIDNNSIKPVEEIKPVVQDTTEGPADFEAEYKKLVAEVQELKNKLDKLTKEKKSEDHQAYETIHDIKNACGVISGFFSFLEDKEISLTEEQKSQYLKTIKDSALDIFELAEGYLGWKKAGSQEVKAEISRVELSLFIESFIGVLRKKANDKKIIFDNKINENISVMADHRMLKSVLDNLILNAIKFTKPGGKISIFSEQKGSLVKIYVNDNGNGIPKEKLDKLFQLGNTTIGTNGEKGTGVGLYTCKKLVKKMNGDISVKVEEGNGTTFILSLPEGGE